MIKCTYFKCDNRVNNDQELLEHVKVKHSNDYNFSIKCPHCKNTFKKFQYFKNHINKFHINKTNCTIDSFKYKCQLSDCIAKFKSRENLKTHLYEHLKGKSKAGCVIKTYIKCLFSECTHVNSDYNCYKSHLSVYHRDDFDSKLFKPDFLIEENTDYFNMNIIDESRGNEVENCWFQKL